MMPGNFDRLGVSRVGADRPDEISFDASIALRRGNGLVAGLDAVIVLGQPVGRGVVGHQRLDDRRSRQTANGQALHAVHKGAAADHAMDKKVVEFYGLGRQFGFRGLHRLTPFQRRSLPGLQGHRPRCYHPNTRKNGAYWGP